MLKCARHLHKLTKMRNLTLAGGVALNCVGNGKILREGPFDRVWIQPAAGDAGGALGVALLVWHHLLAQPRHVNDRDSQSCSLLGPRFSDEEIIDFLKQVGAGHHVCKSEEELIDRVCDLSSHLFLDLQTFCIHFYDPGEFADTNDPTTWNICHPSLADDGGHVMFAMALEANGTQRNHFVIPLNFLEGLLQDLDGVLTVTGKKLVVRPRHTRRRFD